MADRSLSSGCRDKSDFALVAATKSGENHAPELLVERYQKRIFSLAYRITRNREDAQDAVQQSFQKGLMYLNSFHGKSSFCTWLTPDRDQRSPFMSAPKEGSQGNPPGGWIPHDPWCLGLLYGME
jgi:hypothetical protein